MTIWTHRNSILYLHRNAFQSEVCKCMKMLPWHSLLVLQCILHGISLINQCNIQVAKERQKCQTPLTLEKQVYFLALYSSLNFVSFQANCLNNSVSAVLRGTFQAISCENICITEIELSFWWGNLRTTKIEVFLFRRATLFLTGENNICSSGILVAIIPLLFWNNPWRLI